MKNIFVWQHKFYFNLRQQQFGFLKLCISYNIDIVVCLVQSLVIVYFLSLHVCIYLQNKQLFFFTHAIL